MISIRFLLVVLFVVVGSDASAEHSRGKRYLPWGGGGGGGGGFKDLGQFGGTKTITIDLNDLLKGLREGKFGFGGGNNLGFGGGGNLGFGGGNGGGYTGGNTGSGSDDVPTTTGSGGDYHKAALDATNAYRQKHGASPLVLDEKLNKDCQAWAETLAQSGNMRHSCSMCNEYGENLYMMGGQILDPAVQAKNAVKAWYDEVKDYRWNSPVFSGATGHFTALVWKGTQKMGIGLATNPARRSTYVVARYVPPGNMQGAFKENVGPLQ